MGGTSNREPTGGERMSEVDRDSTEVAAGKVWQNRGDGKEYSRKQRSKFWGTEAPGKDKTWEKWKNKSHTIFQYQNKTTATRTSKDKKFKRGQESKSPRELYVRTLWW